MKIVITESQLKKLLNEDDAKSEYSVDFVFDEDDITWDMPDGATAEMIMITSEDGDIESENRSEFWLNIGFSTEGHNHEGRYEKDLGYIDNFWIEDVVLMYPEKKVLDEMFIDLFINDQYIYNRIIELLQQGYDNKMHGKWNDEHITEGKLISENMMQQPIIYVEESDRSFIFEKGTVYAWLYDIPDAQEKLNNREFDAVFFPPSGPMRIGGQNLLTKIWSKDYQKRHKGSEHLIGVIKGWYDEDEKIVYIDMMTVNPKARRQGYNSYMIQKIRERFGLTQDQVKFDDPTDQGNKFIKSKKY